MIAIMADVTLKIAGRNYPITCGDGEQDHALSLAKTLDAKISEATNGKPVTEIRGLLFGGLLLADALNEAHANAKDNEKALAQADKTAKRLAKAEAALETAKQAAAEQERALAEKEKASDLLNNIPQEAMIANAVKALDQLAERIEAMADRIENQS
jgi:cell division protein ZapA